MTRSLIVYAGNDPAYLGIVWEISRDILQAGGTPVAMDLTAVSSGMGDEYNRKVLSFFRVRSPENVFAGVLEEAGIDQIEVAARVNNSSLPRRAIPEAAQSNIDLAVTSALISYARDPQPNEGARTWSRLKRLMETAARQTFFLVTETLELQPEIDTIYVANGRFPHQQAVIEAARLARKELRFYEKGEDAAHFWSEDHSALDRTKTQSNVDTTLANLSDAAAVALGQEWMTARSVPGSPMNIYARFFEESDPDEVVDNGESRTVIGLFTSSQDEFAALGPEWHLDEWLDQWRAFDHVLSHLESPGVDFYLRVHPNFATKSHASFVREKEHIAELQSRHPALSIIWHDEKVNSYELLGQTDAVVVWDSTIGLEASGRGIPAWELAASYYDLYADVRQWFGPGSSPTVAELLYVVDVRRTHRFMAYLAARYHSLSTDGLAMQERLRVPASLGSRLAAVAGTGGAPTIAVGIASILDSFRHRRMAINFTALRRWTKK